MAIALPDHARRAAGVDFHDTANAMATSIATRITTADVEKLINDATLDEASEHDVARVSAHLAAGGWPLADAPPD